MTASFSTLKDADLLCQNAVFRRKTLRNFRGFVALWLCGFVALWLCGFVALWLCGFVALWHNKILAVWAEMFFLDNLIDIKNLKDQRLSASNKNSG
ncbi:MAG: hypothetical protein ACI8VT_002736 [Saprospiraceae bacterium]